MKNSKIYKLPTIEIDNRDDLIDFFSKNMPDCVFEYVEEVNNPVGKQWNYILTTKVETEDIGAAILEYKESLWEKPEQKGIVAIWLKESFPSVDNWYRGTIQP